MTLFLTWYWRQTPNRAGYDAAKVNRWAQMLRANLTIPHEIAVVTDLPEGIDPDIRIIPLPKDFVNVRCKAWAEASGLPQCYRRLKLFDPAAAQYFGATDIVSMDLDVLIWSNLDALFSEPADFRMFKGTSNVRPYNGSMLRIRAGARRQVYERFAADPLAIANAARAKYIGSDQAVISLLLGPGEKVWDVDDGVHHYSSRFERLQGSRFARQPPPGLRMLFFPGNVKPWDGAARLAPWIVDKWAGVGGSGRPAASLRLRAYMDPKGWGKAFQKAAAARGLFCSLFTRSRMVPTGYAFVRLDQQGPQREVSKRMVQELNRIGIRTLPTLREAHWYDDKAAQLEVLGEWMPHTVHITDQAKAEAWLRTEAKFPLVSKSIDGAAGQGVRLIPNLVSALDELERAFSRDGIRSVYDRRQQGYVYWQELVPGLDCDYRVCVVGGYVYGLQRFVRKGDFRASGSGNFRPLTLAADRERVAMEFGAHIAKEIGTDWMAFDIVFGNDGRLLVLEMSSAWTMSAYAAAPCFDRDTLAPTRRTGADSFAIAVEVIEGMHRGDQSAA